MPKRSDEEGGNPYQKDTAGGAGIRFSACELFENVARDGTAFWGSS
jgi:hypothetical protein